MITWRCRALCGEAGVVSSALFQVTSVMCPWRCWWTSRRPRSSTLVLTNCTTSWCCIWTAARTSSLLSQVCTTTLYMCVYHYICVICSSLLGVYYWTFNGAWRIFAYEGELIEEVREVFILQERMREAALGRPSMLWCTWTSPSGRCRWPDSLTWWVVRHCRYGTHHTWPRCITLSKHQLHNCTCTYNKCPAITHSFIFTFTIVSKHKLHWCFNSHNVSPLCHCCVL